MSSTNDQSPPVAIDSGKLRSFGFLVGGVFALIGILPVLLHKSQFRVWALAVSGALVVPAIVYPSALSPIYRIWMKAGHLLGFINNRIILGIVFYGLITPLGLIMKLINKDPLHKTFDPGHSTYRIRREARPGSHMGKQF